MDLPGYIRDFLQTNYYISDEDLALPFDQMKPYVRVLISNTCLRMKENGELEPKSEEEILDAARQQFHADIDSDITPFSEKQLQNFIDNQKVLMGLAKLADKQDKNPSDFSSVASLLTIKRMTSEEYADTPKTFSNFKKIRDEITTELEIKYYTTRYFEAQAQAKTDPDTLQCQSVEDIAIISQMVQTRQSDRIAARFGLSDTPQARAAAKGATLSFAMAEVKTFANRIEQRVKESPYVKKVNELNNTFQQKYPKTYVAAKIIANGAAAMTLGSVFSAYRAAAGINGMRKDFSAYKKEHPEEKGSFWKFIRSPKGRQQLMTTGQNVLRIIPGMRSVGIALSAVKNSDTLRNSVKEAKEKGFDKKRALKIGAAAVGLLAVSVTAAYANDEVADMVNDCISHSFGAVKDTVDNAFDSISSFIPHSVADASTLPDTTDISSLTDHASTLADTAGVPNLTEQTFDFNDMPSADTPNISEQLSSANEVPATDLAAVEPPVSPEVEVNAAQTPAVDPMTKTPVVESTAVETSAANQVETNDASTTPQVEEQSAAVDLDNSATVDGSTLDKNYYKVGDNTMLVESSDGSNTIVFGNGDSQVSYRFIEKEDGSLRMVTQGNISVASLDEQDTELYHNLVAQAQQTGDHSPSIAAQNALRDIKIAEAIKANYAANPTPELEAQYALLSQGAARQGVALGGISENTEGLERTLLRSETTTIHSVSISSTGQASGTIEHANGSSTFINKHDYGTSVTHSTSDGNIHSVSVKKDGSISASGMITREVDPNSKGVTVTRTTYDTNLGSASTVLTDNQTGAHTTILHDSSEDSIRYETGTGNNSVSVSNTARGTVISASTRHADLGNGETLKDATISSTGQASGTIEHANGSSTFINKHDYGTSVTHSTGDGDIHSVSVKKDGSISASGMITREVDPNSKGVTVTRTTYDTNSGNVETVLTNNQTGDHTVIRRTNNGVCFRKENNANQSSTSVTIDNRGNTTIQTKNGKGISISRKDIETGARLLKGLFGGR
ncbi:MAG: hypothetical protein IJ752_06590 [Alphaproteobacteria bacterium]|nr:hypothetical protein [Alphaproteobacteria bacterium]